VTVCAAMSYVNIWRTNYLWILVYYTGFTFQAKVSVYNFIFDVS